LPSQGPMAASSKAPLPRHKSATIRQIGKPYPGFWLLGWGKAA
jgi:hypothetical protein